MLPTIPGRSALTVTPCTAATEPTALNDEDQCSVLVTMVVTASGGGCHDMPWAIAAWIWKNFTRPMPTMNTSNTASVRVIRFFIPSLLGALRSPLSPRASCEVDLLQPGIDGAREPRDLAGVQRGERGHLAIVQLHAARDHLLDRRPRVLPEAAAQAFVGRQQSDDSLHTRLTHVVSAASPSRTVGTAPRAVDPPPPFPHLPTLYPIPPLPPSIHLRPPL